MNLRSLRDETESLTIRLERQRAEVAAGLATPRARAELFRPFGTLLSQDAVALVREARATAEGRRATRLAMLEAHLIELLSEATAGETLDALDRGLRERMASPEQGQSGPLLLIADRLAREPDRDKRARAEMSAANGFDVLTPLFARAWDQRRAIVEEVGEAEPETSDAQPFLDATSAMYEDVLSWWLGRVTGQRFFPHGAERHDLLHALVLAPYNGLFPRGDARAVVDRFASAGLAADVRLDGAPREGKGPWPGAFPIDAPWDVVAIYRGEGGAQGLRDCLRGWGEALHFASVEAERPFEDRCLGDRSLPRAIGLLFQNVTLDRRWLAGVLNEVPSDLVRLLALVELFRVRRSAVSRLVAQDLAREGIDPGSLERGAERFSTVLGARWPAGLVLRECFPPTRPEADVRTAAFEAVLFLFLREQFDEDWWANPRAGAFLLKTFAQGQLEAPAALAKSLGMPSPSLLAAVPRLQDFLG